ncbi:equilibrative nucleobase transporter 1, partial [Hyalella azteca]|uniref:Equilibrative nucleobase transporter 1 n=1 Tax=Hyalella azteca TaxID=294128 RepID=A0A8B7NIB6_HYAAZ
MTCQQAPDLTLSPCRRAAIFMVGALEVLLFGGAVFGWPQLVHLLKMDSVFADLCNDVNTAAGPGINKYEAVPQGEIFNNSRCMALNATPVFLPGHKVGVEQCAPQDEMFALIFTLAVGCYGIPSFLVGFLLHHAGLWPTRISAGAMLCVGFIFLGITTKESPYWLFPAMMLLALGGNQLRMSGLQFADMFPAHKATALTLLASMFSTSASLFLVFQLAERYHIERSIICWCLAGLSTFVLWMTFIMPPHHIPCHDDYDKSGVGEHDELTLSYSYNTGGVAVKEVQELSLLRALVTLSSILLQVWLTANLLAVNIYQLTYNYWITIVSCTTDEAELFSILYSCVNFISVFVDLLEIRSTIFPLAFTTVCTFCMYLLLLFFHPVGVYCSLVFMALTRPCVVAVATAFVRI